MKAVVIEKPGGPEVLVWRNVTTPEPNEDEVLVRVRAVGVNRADVLQRMGRYPAPPFVVSDIPGLEYAGQIERVGSRVPGFSVGDRVFGLVSGGAYAEFLVAHARTVMHIPETLDFVAAASVPEAFITAHDALFARGNLRPGMTALVHAAASGVGLAAVQLAHAARARVLGTSRSADKLFRARAYGLDLGIAADEFAQRAGELEALGVHVVVDLVGGSNLGANLRILTTEGRWILVGMLGGHHADLDMALLMRKRLTLVGTALRSRPVEEKIVATRIFANEVVPLLAQGLVRAAVDTTFPIEEAAAAHARMEANLNFGKIVLMVG